MRDDGNDGTLRKSEHASAMANARSEKLGAERRSEIAKRAATARWVPQATFGGEDKPLRIGDIQIPCYVLADGRRVLTQRGLLSGIGLSEGGGKGGERKIATLMASLNEKGFDVRDLVARANSPIRFIPPHGGIHAFGYEATILPDVCAVLIEAGRQGKLGRRLEHLAERAAILQHGFATVGIIALVDEATGYQAHREHDALAKILQQFIAKELRPYVKTFPPEFYKEMYRLRSWTYPTGSSARPPLVGKLTNSIVYDRLAPGVREALDQLIPRDDKGRLKYHKHRHLTEDVGHPKLREHLAVTVAFMKISKTWEQFVRRLDEVSPKYGKTGLLPLRDDPGDDSDAVG
jgi:hypothetical protein